MKKALIILIIIIVLTGLFGYFFKKQIVTLFSQPSFPPSVNKDEINTNINQAPSPNIQVVQQNLQIPWEIAFLPDGRILVTERVGNLLIFNSEKKVIKIDGVKHVGEGGLLGLAVHPNFSTNQWLYLYFTTENQGQLINRVSRYKLIEDILTEESIIIDNIPAANFHDGGRIKFGPDGKLYITTGDANKSSSAQNINSLAGKILRLNDDGSVPADNPFGNAVYSYGHRNPQGLAWDNLNRLWATEHGRSGLQSGLDELNLIQVGQNYGWPEIQGDETKAGMATAVINSGPNITWAPSGAVYWDGSIFFTGLRGQALYEAKIIGERQVELKTHLFQQFGRLRTVFLGPDDFFYLATNNTDGRGQKQEGDDKIIKINPQIFRE